jgi:hypothetical protein
MRKFLMATVAALFALPCTAQAKVPVLDLGGICHFMPIIVKHSNVHGFSNFDCQTGNFVGMIATTNTGERSVIASVQMVSQPGQYLLKISYPLVSGGTWSMYYTKDGYTMKRYQSGTYKVIK